MSDGATGQASFKAPAADTTPNSAALEGCSAVWTPDWKYCRPEKFATVHGWRYAKGTITVGTSDSTTHTLGVAEESMNGDFSASGKTSSSYSTANDSSTSQPGLIDADVYNKMNYRRKAFTCLTFSKWYQYSAYDFVTSTPDTYNAMYHNCSHKNKDATWSTSTARNTTYKTGMEFGPISLLAQSGYGSSVRIAFKFDRAGQICGNLAGGPLQSTRVSTGPE